MSTFIDYANKLKNYVPSLSPQQSEDFINIAWRHIRQSNDEWTFLYKEEFWLSPDIIQLQGLGVVQFSDEVALTHDALVALGNQSNPALTQRQARFGSSGGPIYSIAATDILYSPDDGSITAADNTLFSTAGVFDAAHVGLLIVVEGAGLAGADLETTIASFTSPTEVELTAPALTTVVNATFTLGSTLTLERVFNEATNSNASAQIFRIYYSPLTTDFDRLDHLVDPIMGYEWGWEIRDRDELDRRDPQRSAQGQPYQLYYYRYNDVTGLPEYEMWPAPNVQRAYTASLWRSGVDFVDDDDALPPRLSEELLLLRARMEVYEWGMVSDPDAARRRSFENALSFVRSRYSTEGRPGAPLGLLDQAIRRDQSIYLKQFKRYPRHPGPGWPVDSRFMQSHAIPAGYGF